MSIFNYSEQRLNKEQARKLILRIAKSGHILLSAHARTRLLERSIVFNDVINVLVSPSMRVTRVETANSTLSYCCETNKLVVVVGFTKNADGLVVITVFKAARKVNL